MVLDFLCTHSSGSIYWLVYCTFDCHKILRNSVNTQKLAPYKELQCQITPTASFRSVQGVAISCHRGSGASILDLGSNRLTLIIVQKLSLAQFSFQ